MLRFDKYGSVIRKMHAFVPSVIGIGKVERHWKTKGNIHEYRDDTHSQRSFRRILKVRKTMESSEGKTTWSCGKSIKSFDIESYPNIYVLSKILRTVAVTSRECERSGIVLKRLGTYLWASIGQNRLSTSIDAYKLGYWHWC